MPQQQRSTPGQASCILRPGPHASVSRRRGKWRQRRRRRRQRRHRRQRWRGGERSRRPARSCPASKGGKKSKRGHSARSRSPAARPKQRWQSGKGNTVHSWRHSALRGIAKEGGTEARKGTWTRRRGRKGASPRLIPLKPHATVQIRSPAPVVARPAVWTEPFWAAVPLLYVLWDTSMPEKRACWTSFGRQTCRARKFVA
mmetsp:Transcript_84518/g.247900  ORF Transcript_84518/g.247900 Transcript_84518/m.247900 type:complete len:200 (+) Transcript_84518:113-712(+)